MASQAQLKSEPVSARSAPFREWLYDERLIRVFEVGVPVLSIVVAALTYFTIAGDDGAPQMLSPPLVALLLVANLVPGIGIIVLVARRVAVRRAARAGGGGRLHVRLVAIFSALASVPLLLLAIFASLLFQYGVEFWFSDRARGMLENASILARQSYQQALDQVELETVTAAGDIDTYLRTNPIDNPDFPAGFLQQIYYRNLTEGAIVSVTSQNGVQMFAFVNPYDRNIAAQIDAGAIRQLRQGKPSVVIDRGDRIAAFAPLASQPNLFLYAARASNPQMRPQFARANAVLADYRSLLGRSRSLQLQFNAVLLGVSLLIVAIATWIAIRVADRFVRPVGELVGMARRIAEGDLTARAAAPTSDDEIATLATTFNRMTERLGEQTGALIAANAQLDSRRALIEAVMSGVSAGIISADLDGMVRLINASALELLANDEAAVVGQPLRRIAPELAATIAEGEREAIVQVNAAGEPLTLAVKIAQDASGYILTFDDITQQLLDQRRAAWSDVARRIAHEIKNPLTPIQLAAERLRRRYGSKVDPDDTTFERLTDTIVRQVGDLRRMVDEFSSFARMPKPVFREESLLDIVRQALFLFEVAHPAISFTLDGADEPFPLVCDRRQLGQAVTNILKNAIEAISARSEGAPPGAIDVRIRREPDGVRLAIADNGTGLPADRDRIVEPYVTTRSRGTGLGLAIVKKIIEEHAGTILFEDAPGGGSIVTLCFEPRALAALTGDASPNPERMP